MQIKSCGISWLNVTEIVPNSGLEIYMVNIEITIEKNRHPESQ